jgi:hypothetical protein
MRPIVVLGGYGRLGHFCVQQVVEHTRARIIVAGRNVQRAQALALRYPERATGVYADARDVRTLARALEGAGALLLCCSAELDTALHLAVGLRLPVISPATSPLSRPEALAEQAWQAQVPIVLHAGALPGVLAELLVRRLPAIHDLRIASTGPWSIQPQTLREPRPGLGHWFPQRWSFPDPVGPMSVRPAHSPDLEGFAPAHCVERLTYLEPIRGAVGRSLDRLLGRPRDPTFCVTAEARVYPRSNTPDAALSVIAPTPLHAASALVGALLGSLLAGRVPRGVLTPREARAPTALLGELEKRGLRVSTQF